MNNPKDIRLPLMASRAEVDAIDAWRYSNMIPSRAEAVRRLIVRGLQADPPPAEASPPEPNEAPPSETPDLSHVGKYPAAEIAYAGDRVKGVGVDIPVGLKIQLDWLAKANRKKIHAQVRDLLRPAVDTELRRLGIEP